MAFDIVFWVMAIVAVASALLVVTMRNIFRAALAMVLCFFVVAGLYATLGADFLAVIQVLIYVGAISILIILAIMLTRDVSRAGRASSVGGAAAVAFLLFGSAMVVGLSWSDWQTREALEFQTTIDKLGPKVFAETGFVLPLVISAALLLAAIIGALVLIKDE